MVAIARVLLNDNRLLLVDEPTKGLAPQVVTEVADALERAAELTTVLLVEQNLAVVARARAAGRRARQGRVVHTGPAAELLGDSAKAALAARRRRRRALSTFVLLTLTGLGLAALYFLVASGLSLVFGLMDVLNFAHGAVPLRRRVRHLVDVDERSTARRAGCSSARSPGSPSAPCSPRWSSSC